MLITGLILALHEGLFNSGLYSVIFWLQVLFYLAALFGWYLETRSVKFKILFVPYYFFIMNLSVFLGLKRYLKGTQSVNWERAKRGKG